LVRDGFGQHPGRRSRDFDAVITLVWTSNPLEMLFAIWSKGKLADDLMGRFDCSRTSRILAIVSTL
jgi:hypothetical protein